MKLSKMAMESFRVFFFVLLFAASPLLQVARCQSEADVDVAEAVEGGELGIVGEDVQDFGDGNFGPAPGVETVFIFPKNSAKLVVAGEETELLVGMENVVHLLDFNAYQFCISHASPLLCLGVTFKYHCNPSKCSSPFRSSNACTKSYSADLQQSICVPFSASYFPLHVCC